MEEPPMYITSRKKWIRRAVIPTAHFWQKAKL